MGDSGSSCVSRHPISPARRQENLEWVPCCNGKHSGSSLHARETGIQWRRRHRFRSYAGFRKCFIHVESSKGNSPFPALLNHLRYFHTTDTRDGVFDTFAASHHSQSSITSKAKDGLFRYPMSSSMARIPWIYQPIKTLRIDVGHLLLISPLESGLQNDHGRSVPLGGVGIHPML